MKIDVFRGNRLLFITWFVMLCALGWMLFLFPKPEFFIILNSHHTPALDIFFKGATLLGDGLFVIAVGIVLFFVRKRALSFLVLASYGLSGLIVQVIKHWFPEPRPALYLQLHRVEYNYFIEGISLHNHFSFPSGHTTSAFALAAALSLLSRDKRWTPILLLAALAVGYSRVYLGQHFPEDVIAGMAIGVFSAWVTFLIAGNLFLSWQRKLQKFL